MNRKRTQGFTLIEVLVVIAIISVLITILLPSFNAARKKPYDVAALQCGKAIVTAQVTYIAEHNETPASSIAQLNNSDVNEQCVNAGVQVSTGGPAATISDPGNSNINIGGSNYAFLLWHPNGTSIYVYNRDVPYQHFAKVN
jgi:type IV pilus assembly protein PilA